MDFGVFLVDHKESILAIQLLTSIVCLLCNLYFALRFSAVTTFNLNLRIIMVVFQLFTATIAFLHPLLCFVPERWYSIEEKQYVGAFVYYLLQYCVKVCLFIMCSKFMALGLERRLAVKYRVNYEQEDGTRVKRLLIRSITLLTTILSIKSILIFYFDNSGSLKSRIERAILVEKCPAVLIAVHLFGGLSWSYGLYEFLRLSKHLKRHWYTGQTLSESYQIKQSGAVVEVLKPIVVAFLIMLVSNSAIMGVSLHLYYVQGYSVNSPLFVTLMNIEYTDTAFYNLFSTGYMLWFFKPVRKLILQDLSKLCRIDIRPKTVVSSEINWDKEREDHFAYLSTYWNSAAAARRLNQQ